MSLTAGEKLGPYEVLSPIGAGGMGEVYKARDTRLDRFVAIKVLPEPISKREDLRRRFEREARIVASLNHPNICVVHDIGSHDGSGYMVMEYLEGEALSARIARGALPLDQALGFATQIADALDRAHRAGVTHRDIKPQNIMLTRDGVKVLDFGLAKSVPKTGTAEVTLTVTLTVEGSLPGTPQYMAPEQFDGIEADARSDIWALGAVLFEMVTGRRAFQGKSYSSLLGAILSADLPPMAVKPFTPSALEKLVRRCLNKDPEDRYQSVRDVLLDLRSIATQPEAAQAPASATRVGYGVVAAAMTCVAAFAGFGWWRATRPVERPLVQLDVDLGPDVSLGSSFGADVIISPDSTRLVFVTKGRLLTRRLNQPKATELAGTEGAYAPFFSPDGEWVAFFGGGKLKKISVESGAAITLCDAPSARGGAWGEDHTIIATLSSTGGLSRIPDAGGTPQSLTEVAQGESAHRWPQILPGGKAVLFTAARTGGFDSANIEAMSFQDRRRKTLQRSGTYGRYLATPNRATPGQAGHLFYINKGTLFAVPFDPDTLEAHGTPAPVRKEVAYSQINGSAQFDFSRDGTLVYQSGGAGRVVTLQWLSGGDKLEPLPAKPGPYTQPHISPDGRLLALTVPGASGTDIWIYDWRRDAMSPLTFGDGNFTHPVWSPDGRYLAFRTDSGIFWTRADAAGKPQPLTQSKKAQLPWSFSPDGKRLAFGESGAGGLDLWTVPVENEGGLLRAGKPEIFLQTPVAESYPAFSPDGRWIAYQSLESGIGAIHVRSFPDKGRKWQISNSGGSFAIWSRNGRELYYRTLDHQIMVVSYRASGDSFVADKPMLWSQKRLADTSLFQNLDIHPDGKRFVALMPAEAPRAKTQVTMLLNFSDEVRRRLSASK